MDDLLAPSVEDDDFELTKPSSLRDQYFPPDLLPSDYLSRAMLWNACPPRLRADLARRRSIVAIIEPPARDWLDLVFDAARSLFSRAQFLTKSDPRGKKSSSQDTLLHTGVSCGQSVSSDIRN